MKIKAWLCNQVPFSRDISRPINLFYRIGISVQDFSLKVEVNNMHNQKLRVINFFNAKITYSYKIIYRDYKVEEFTDSNQFDTTFFIEINRTRQIKEIIYSFHLSPPECLPFQTSFNAVNF